MKIIAILITLFGIFEAISNIIYLIKTGGIQSAYSQHKEIPPSVPEIRMRKKVYTMLAVGIVLFSTGLIALLTGQYMLVKVAFPLYALYTLAEAVCYRKHVLGWCLAGLMILLAVLLLTL